MTSPRVHRKPLSPLPPCDVVDCTEGGMLSTVQNGSWHFDEDGKPLGGDHIRLCQEHWNQKWDWDCHRSTVPRPAFLDSYFEPTPVPTQEVAPF